MFKSASFQILPLLLVCFLSACGGGGSGGVSPIEPGPSPDSQVPPTVDEPTAILLRSFEIESQSDTRPEDALTEVNTTWNQGSFSFQFEAEAYDATTRSRRFDYALYLSADDSLNPVDDKLVKSGSCQTDDAHIGYSCDQLEQQFCRLYPQNAYYVATCRNKSGQAERNTVITDLFSTLPQELTAFLQVCHTNNDNGRPLRVCMVRGQLVTVY